MPRQYEHIRDSYVARGMDYDKAQSIAAATYNKHHPGHPVTGHSEGGSKPRRKKSAPSIMRYGAKKRSASASY